MPTPTDTEKTRAWIRGLKMAMRMGYQSIRDGRLIAMGYENGWVAAIRAARRKNRADNR